MTCCYRFPVGRVPALLTDFLTHPPIAWNLIY